MNVVDLTFGMAAQPSTDAQASGPMPGLIFGESEFEALITPMIEENEPETIPQEARAGQLEAGEFGIAENDQLISDLPLRFDITGAEVDPPERDHLPAIHPAIDQSETAGQFISRPGAIHPESADIRPIEGLAYALRSAEPGPETGQFVGQDQKDVPLPEQTRESVQSPESVSAWERPLNSAVTTGDQVPETAMDRAIPVSVSSGSHSPEADPKVNVARTAPNSAPEVQPRSATVDGPENVGQAVERDVIEELPDAVERSTPVNIPNLRESGADTSVRRETEPMNRTPDAPRAPVGQANPMPFAHFERAATDGPPTRETSMDDLPRPVGTIAANLLDDLPTTQHLRNERAETARTIVEPMVLWPTVSRTLAQPVPLGELSLTETPEIPSAWQSETISSRMIHQIVTAAKVRLFEGGANMTLRLDPPHLGTIRLSVSATEGVVTANLVTTSESARLILEADLGSLRQALANSGIDVDSVNVSVGDREQAWSMFQGDGQDADQAGGSNPRLATVSAAASTSAVAERSAWKSGAIDYLA